MGKTGIFKRRKPLLQKPKTNLRLQDFDKLSVAKPDEFLTNPENIALAVFECLTNNDSVGAMEMIETYLEAVNKSKLRKKSSLAKSTMYSALKHRNPTIRTLAKIMHGATH